MIRDFKVKEKLFNKMSKTYYELIDQTKMNDLEYGSLLEIGDKIIAMEDRYKENM